METPLFQNVRGFNYSDFDRMKTMIANHEKEKRQMQERFDRKLEEAKELVYKKGFYEGVMLVGSQAGKRVGAARACERRWRRRSRSCSRR